MNGLNQYTAAGPATFTYDANGNLTSDGTTSYVYDVENRLVSASNGASLVYDPLGRLFQTSGGSAGTTQFLYDGDAMIAEYNSSGAMLRRYLHGPGVDEPLIWYEGADLTTNRRRLSADRQGSIVSVADTSSNILTINTYDAWGVPKAGNDGRFQYTGQAWVGELGMYYYKARIYSPMLGRFLQPDPVGYEGGINLYAYVGNDPINLTDPSGNNPACAPECFEQVHTRTRVDDYRDMVGADAWSEAYDAYKAGNYAEALGSAFSGTMAMLGASPAGRAANFARAGAQTIARMGGRVQVLNRLHYRAAMREARGEVVASRPDGKPFDHINELREATRGLANDVRRAEALIRSGKLDDAMAGRVREAVAKGQSLLNEARAVLQRIHTCTGTRLC